MKNYGEPAILVPQMREIISKGESFWLVVTGSSMTPTLKHLRDRVCVSPFDGTPKKGDILLTETRGNHCLLHRVVKYEDGMVYYNGDALTTREGPLPAADVIGIVTQIERNGKIIPVSDLRYRIWSSVWQRSVRFRRLIFRICGKIKRVFAVYRHIDIDN